MKNPTDKRQSCWVRWMLAQCRTYNGCRRRSVGIETLALCPWRRPCKRIDTGLIIPQVSPETEERTRYRHAEKRNSSGKSD
jgi:hypothetical protein